MGNIESKRQQNEQKFGNWESLPSGGQQYWYEVPGQAGWKARYAKDVNSMEVSIRFYQEIYNAQGELVDIHQ